MKSVDISNPRSQFDKLVEQYKKSASKDLLNQLYQKEETIQEKNARNNENTQESKWKVKGISEEIKQKPWHQGGDSSAGMQALPVGKIIEPKVFRKDNTGV